MFQAYSDILYCNIGFLCPSTRLSFERVYDTTHCRQVILNRDAHAIIPPRKNAQPWKDQQVRSIERNELLKLVKWQAHRFGKSRLVITIKLGCVFISFNEAN